MTKTEKNIAVINLIDALVDAAGQGLTRGDLRAMAYAVLLTDRPIVGIAEVLDPQAHAAVAELAPKCRAVRDVILSADQEIVAAL